MTVTLTWHGHATFSIDVNGTKLLIDPFLNDSPVSKIGADDVNADFVLVTHGHGDHIADARSIAERCDAQIIANFEISDWFNKGGYAKTHPMHIGGGFSFPFGYLKMTIAFHGSGLPDGSYGGNPGGFLIKTEEKNIYVAGDTALYSDMKLIGDHGIDLAILPIGDNFTMGPDDAVIATQFLRPAQVVPCHFNTFGYIMQDPNAWAEKIRAQTSAEPIVMEIEGSHTL